MRRTSSRKLLAALSGAGLLALLAVLAGCDSGGGGGSGKTTQGPLTVGFIYIGPKKDYGYTQAHQQGAEAVKKMADVQVLEVEKVPETEDVQQRMKKLIDVEGAQVIFASSFGYFQPHVLEMAKKYPKIQFMHCGGPWKKGDPENICSYFGYIDECQYLNGIVAGHMTKTNKLGFVAAKPIPQVRRNINAFFLGAHSVNPKAEVQVIFTGDWLNPNEEANATKILIDKGCDVFTCHVDSPQVVVETASKAGKMICGYHASQADLAGDLYLTGAEWNWEALYPKLVEKVKKGEKVDNYIRGGLKDGLVKTSPYGKMVTDAAKKDADAAKEKLKKGDFVIFKGPLTGTDDKGEKVTIPAGTEFKQDDPKLEEMNYMLEGVFVAK
jgi:simple sugar transport system substrate-binding protein